jgi:hypothetical protein
MMQGSCHCGAVTIRVPERPPFLNACNCTLCWKVGTMWGYFPVSEVEFSGEVSSYLRSDVPNASMAAEYCGKCGATTNWRRLDADAPDRMGVNMLLFDPAELAGLELRYGDRRNHERSNPQPSYRPPTIFDGAGAKA